MLATGEESHLVRLWEISSGHCILELKGHSGPVSSVAFLADTSAGGHLMLVSGGESCRVWILAPPEACQGSSPGCFDSQKVALGQKGGLEETEGQVQKAGTPQVPLDCAARIIDGDIDSLICFAVLEGHNGRITSVDVAMCPLSPMREVEDISSGTEAIVTVVTGSMDNTARVWHLYLPLDCEGRWIPPPFENHVDDGTRCSKGKSEGTPAPISEGTPAPLTPIKWSLKWSLEGHLGVVWGVSLSSCRRCIATCGDDGTTRVWRMLDGTCSSVLGGHKESVWGVRFSSPRSAAAEAEGRVELATASGDGTARLWDLRKGCLAAAAEEEVSLGAVSDDVCGASTAGDADARCVGCLEGHTERVTSLAFNPDGCLVATASTDETVSLLG